MKSIAMAFDLFRDLTPEYRAQDETIMGRCLDLLIMRNEQWLHRRPDTPLLYPHEIYARLGMPVPPDAPVSGVYYQLEPEDEEEFASIPRVIRMGSGDCDDLCGWRVAELRVRFGDPGARIMWVGEEYDNDGDGVADYIQYHVMVLRGDGVIEDPSLFLGMSETPESIRAEMEEDVPEQYPADTQWDWRYAA